MTVIKKMIEDLSSVTFISPSQERLDGIIAASEFIDSDEFDRLPWEYSGGDEDEDDEEEWW